MKAIEYTTKVAGLRSNKFNLLFGRYKGKTCRFHLSKLKDFHKTAKSRGMQHILYLFMFTNLFIKGGVLADEMGLGKFFFFLLCFL